MERNPEHENVNQVSWNGRKYESKFILWKGVMNSMNHEVESITQTVWVNVRHPSVFSMEDKSVKNVFYETPCKHSTGTQEDVQRNWTFHDREKMNLKRKHGQYNNIIWCFWTLFQKIIIKHAHMSHWVNQMFWLVNERVIVLECPIVLVDLI